MDGEPATPLPEAPTRARIIAAAEQLFAERGYHGARMREIAAAVGIQKASLFHHFAGKESLHRAVLAQSAADTSKVFEAALAPTASFPDRLRRLISAYVDLVAERPARTRMFLRTCLDGGPLPAAIEAEFGPLFEILEGFITDGQRAGAFRPLAPGPLVLSMLGIIAFYFSSAQLVAPRWTAEMVRRGDFTSAVKEQVTQIAERMLLML